MVCSESTQSGYGCLPTAMHLFSDVPTTALAQTANSSVIFRVTATHNVTRTTNNTCTHTHTHTHTRARVYLYISVYLYFYFIIICTSLGQNYAKTYRQIAATVAGAEGLQVGAVDCGDKINGDVCREQGVKSYPTLKLFPK